MIPYDPKIVNESHFVCPVGMSLASNKRFIVAGNKPWNREIFNERLASEPGEWNYASDSSQLEQQVARQPQPEYIFFIHWSTKIPANLYENYNCIGFHMTDLPYGRGGTPLQNLIQRGHDETKLTAFQITEEMDAGPVYMKRPLSLDGTAEEIYRRATHRSAEMILDIIESEPEPRPQEGTVVTFDRRTPDQSEIEEFDSLEDLYNFIRMLDAEGYPRAFLEQGGFRFEFKKPSWEGDQLETLVTITSLD